MAFTGRCRLAIDEGVVGAIPERDYPIRDGTRARSRGGPCLDASGGGLGPWKRSNKRGRHRNSGQSTRHPLYAGME